MCAEFRSYSGIKACFVQSINTDLQPLVSNCVQPFLTSYEPRQRLRSQGNQQAKNVKLQGKYKNSFTNYSLHFLHSTQNKTIDRSDQDQEEAAGKHIHGAMERSRVPPLTMFVRSIERPPKGRLDKAPRQEAKELDDD